MLLQYCIMMRSCNDATATSSTATAAAAASTTSTTTSTTTTITATAATAKLCPCFRKSGRLLFSPNKNTGRRRRLLSPSVRKDLIKQSNECDFC